MIGENMSIRISVITVCYNAQDTICDTINSVIEQSELPYEYIIMDGASSDKTVSRAEKMTDKYPWVKIRSSKDSGLYDAMNKGVAESCGDYVIFLNSGDLFSDTDVIADIRKIIDDTAERPELIYSDVIRDYGDHRVEERYGGRRSTFILMLSGKMPCHQGIFASRELLKKYPFDLRYSITADFNFFMKCMRYNVTMLHTDRETVISECRDGISSRKDNLDKMREQDDQSMKELYPVWYELMRPVKYIKRCISG